jgi:phage terminase small subunit
MNKLSPKQVRFCEEYIIDLNATQAAIRAGYSEKSAYAIGFENLKKHEVQARIQELRAVIFIDSKATIDRLVADNLAIMDMPITDFVTEANGVWSLKPVEEWPPALLRLVTIKGFSHRGVPQFSFDKANARDQLAKLIGAYGDFNTSLGTLRKYGIYLKQSKDGVWSVADSVQ